MYELFTSIHSQLR